ncbi:sensor histidine kinase [Microcella sp.]|uniref:sensor histidine kinase n=1 Tax=Microcella sp. TaxID=1913979 RepID=UPI003F71E0C5
MSASAPHPLRPAPPPREVTAAALVRGLASAQRLIGPASLVLALALMVEVAVRSEGAAALGALVLWWSPAFVAAVVLALRPTVPTALLTVGVGLVAGTGFVATILQAYTPEQSRGLFLVEALAWALMFIGAVRPNAADGVLWVAVGLGAGTVALVAGHVIAGRPLALSPDRLVDAVIMAVAYAVIALGGRRRRDRVPELPDAALVSRRQHAAQRRERAAAALVHDTVLASLTLLERGESRLDDRVRQGIRRDLDAVAQASATSVGVVSAAPVEGSLAARLLAIVDDLRWSGLRVDLTGAEALATTSVVTDSAAEAVLAAMTAALENVRHHSGVDRVEVTVGRTARALTVLVVDGGTGFDSDAVPTDRLGLRESIHGRLSRVGGTARVWSNESGTTVMLTVPIEATAEGPP